DNFAGSDAAGGQLPQLFDPDAIGLRVAVTIKLEAADELLGQRAARAFGQDRDLGAQVVAGLEVSLLLAIFVDAFIVGSHASHSRMERGSSSAPDRQCWPISRAFSRTQMFSLVSCASGFFWLCSSISCERRSAQASPAGPPPTMTTSASICGRSMPGIGLRKMIIVC